MSLTASSTPSATAHDHPPGPARATGLPRLPGSTHAVLLLCAQAGLAVTPQRTSHGFRLWLLAEDPDSGFGCLGLDEAGRVVALQLFGGLDDPRLVADPLVRTQASSRGFPGVLAALTHFRNIHQDSPDRIQHRPGLPAADVPTPRRWHRAA